MISFAAAASSRAVTAKSTSLFITPFEQLILISAILVFLVWKEVVT